MDRRELLKLIALATGSVVIGGEFFLSGCKNKDAGTGMMFSAGDISFLDEVAETILPKTKTPGAKDAEVGKFMTVMVTDCYDENDQRIFHEGMKKLDDACDKRHHTTFMKATPQQRTELLLAADKEAKDYNKKKAEADKPEYEKAKTDLVYKKHLLPNHYFTQMKQLALLGYFTSKPALQQVFDYHAVPQRYDGNTPYKKGDKMFV
jgi:Gluconate 2-dehydrogenase subunit 3